MRPKVETLPPHCVAGLHNAVPRHGDARRKRAGRSVARGGKRCSPSPHLICQAVPCAFSPKHRPLHALLPGEHSRSKPQRSSHAVHWRKRTLNALPGLRSLAVPVAGDLPSELAGEME